ncbi:MAG: glycosyltransferase [Candidatus Scalindua sp.]|nr:glycosyltransferase [Candidatus Scalindua sp.]
MLKIIRQLNDDKPYILFMNCPNISPDNLLDEILKGSPLSIFDFSDDFVELTYGKQMKELFRRNIAKYARAADIVLTVNDHIKKKYEHLYSNIHVIRNATNYDNFDRKNYKPVDFLEKIKNDKNPVIGYIGNISMSRMDEGLLDFLLERRPDWQFVFIGPAHSDFKKRYLPYKNLHFIAAVDYQSLPDYMRYFDVAIVPFQNNTITRGNGLLKLRDYLAMGKPVVSSKVDEADDLRDVIRIAQRPSDFIEEIEKALHDDNEADVFKRKNVALKNSWHNRIKELEELLKSHLKFN